MTIPFYNVRDLYAGNGKSTKFPYTFVVKDTSHIKVSLIDPDGDATVLVEDTDYEVIGIDETIDRYVSYPLTGDPLPDNYQLLLELELPIKQLLDFTDNIFDPEKHEAAFDYLTQLKSQQQSQIDRIAKVPIIHDIFQVLNENDMGGLDPDRFNPPSQSSVSVYTPNLISDDDLEDGMGSDLAPSQRADKVYADSLIDTDTTLSGESTVIAPSQKAALTYLKPYLAPPAKDSTYLCLHFPAIKDTSYGAALYYAYFDLDLSEPEYAQFRNRFTATPTQGWAVATDMYFDGADYYPIVCGYIYGLSSVDKFVFGAQRLDGGYISGSICNVAIYLKP